MKKLIAQEALKILLSRKMSMEHCKEINTVQSCKAGKDFLECEITSCGFGILLFLGYCKLKPASIFINNTTNLNAHSAVLKTILALYFPEQKSSDEIFALVTYEDKNIETYIRDITKYLENKKYIANKSTWRYWGRLSPYERSIQFLQLIIQHENYWLDRVLDKTE